MDEALGALQKIERVPIALRLEGGAGLGGRGSCAGLLLGRRLGEGRAGVGPERQRERGAQEGGGEGSDAFHRSGA